MACRRRHHTPTPKAARRSYGQRVCHTRGPPSVICGLVFSVPVSPRVGKAGGNDDNTRDDMNASQHFMTDSSTMGSDLKVVTKTENPEKERNGEQGWGETGSISPSAVRFSPPPSPSAVRFSPPPSPRALRLSPRLSTRSWNRLGPTPRTSRLLHMVLSRWLCGGVRAAVGSWSPAI